MTVNSKLLRFMFCGVIAATTYAFTASAQQTTTTTALGSDFWNGSMDSALFQLHENGGAQACTGTEVFVPVRGALGFCMDANENAAGLLEWEDAREVCAAAGKRLPEPAEYKHACKASIGGLNNLTDDWEWASNFWIPFRNPFAISSVYTSGVISVRSGQGSCTAANFGWIANDTSAPPTVAFRCVR